MRFIYNPYLCNVGKGIIPLLTLIKINIMANSTKTSVSTVLVNDLLVAKSEIEHILPTLTTNSFIATNDDYLFVGEGNGLNGTSLAIRNLKNANRAIEWETEEEALEAVRDLNLMTASGKQVVVNVITKKAFLEEQMEGVKGMLNLLG